MIIVTRDARPLVEATPRIDTIAVRRELRVSLGVAICWRVRGVVFGGKLYAKPNGDVAGGIVAIFPDGACELARFVAEPARLGGTMVRAECPRCRARVRYLYARGRALACQQCHGLAWESQRMTKLARSLTARRRIASRLGIEEFDDGPEGGTIIATGDKPRAMRWARFGRESARYERASAATVKAFGESLRSRRYRLHIPSGYTRRTPVERVVPEPVGRGR